MKTFSFLNMTAFCASLFISADSLSQDFNFEKRSRQEVFEYELKQKGAFKDSVNYSILVNPLLDAEIHRNSKAYIFQRTTDDFDPQLHVWYYFEPLNQTIAGIKYNWGLYNPDFSPVMQKERLRFLSTRENEFSEKYKAVSRELEMQFGEPVKTISVADNKDLFSEQIYWEDAEKIIGLSIRFDRRLKDVTGAGILADYKIEVMVSYK